MDEVKNALKKKFESGSSNKNNRKKNEKCCVKELILEI